MKRFALLALLFGLTFSLCADSAAIEPDASEYIKLEYSSQVVKITSPSNFASGGTGFQLRAPSGKVYTLTNGHVCQLQESGYVAIHIPGTSRWFRGRVIDVADETDLCIVEGLPAASGLEIADKFDESKRVYVLGHPLLKPLTVSSGFVIERNVFQIIESIGGEKCEGPGREKKEIDVGFFMAEVCIRSVDAYDSSAVIYPGNSGSPVFNSQGYVVGVIFAGQQSTGHGLFVPLDVLKKYLEIY